jgi:hypothetical protein
MIARAFTAYQLDSLIDNIGGYCRELEPTLLIVNGITDLLFDRDVPQDEAEDMITGWTATITAQTRHHNTITLVTSRHRDTRFSTLLESSMDEVIQFQRQQKNVLVSIPAQRQWLWYRPVPMYQRTIDDFMEVEDGTNPPHL